MKQVHVTDVRPAAEPGPHTVLVGVGTDIETDRPIAFAGEPRMMWSIRHALDQETADMVIVVVEDWQVILCQADRGCGLPPAADSVRLWCRGHERLIGGDPSTLRDEDGPWGGGFAPNH